MSNPELNKKKQYLTGIIISLVFSIILIMLLELGLRWANYGYSPHFLIERKVEGKEVYMNNIFYTGKFFTPELIRTPTPLIINKTKEKNTIRIAIAGESAALGDPDYSFGFSRILKIMLEDAYPHLHFEIINTSITAINSHIILPIVKETHKKLKPDIYLIYMGNNEVIGPFGPHAAFSSYTSNRNLIKLNIAVNSTRIGTLARNAGRAISGEKLPEQWDGMEMFLNYKVKPDDPILQDIHNNFQKNLEEICQITSKDAKVILSPVVVNLRDCAPFYSENNERLDSVSKSKFDELFHEAILLNKSGNYMHAGQLIQQALQLNDRHAMAHYIFAQILLQKKDHELAREHFYLALKYDELKFRADAKLNQIIADVYDKFSHNSNVSYLNMIELVNDSVYNKMAGSEIFLEHVHFNFYGNYLLAHFFKQKIEQVLELRNESSPTKHVHYYQRRLAYTPYEAYKIHNNILSRMNKSPFVERVGNDHEKKAITEKIRMIQQYEPLEDDYLHALHHSPDDWKIKYNYALFLMAQKKYNRKAFALLQEAKKNAPQNAAVDFNMGVWHENNHNYKQALQHYQDAVKIFPYYRDATKNMATLMLIDGAKDVPVTDLKLNDSELFDVYRKAGQLSISKGNSNRALQLYEKAYGYDPHNAEVVYSLASIYVQKQSFSDAIKVLEQYGNYDSLHANGLYTLALAYEGVNEHETALNYFLKSYDRNASNPILLSKIAHMHFILENYGKSIEYFHKSIEKNPEQRLEYVFTNMALAYSKHGDSDKAIHYLKQAHSLAPDERYIMQALAREYQLSGNTRKYNEINDLLQ